MAKGKPDRAQPPTPGTARDPLRDGGDEESPEFDTHIKVPLAFKQRLEDITRRINQKRQRERKKKRALGWFVVTHLEEWMALAEAALGIEYKPPEE